MPRHPTKVKPPSMKETISDLWEHAIKTAAQVAAEISDQYQFPYLIAFSLYEYLQRYAWNLMMNMTHNKGWHTRFYWAVRTEAERIGWKINRWLTTVNNEERQRLAAELDEEMSRLNKSEVSGNGVA